MNCSSLQASDGTLSGPLAKQVFEIMLETGEMHLGVIVESRGLKQVTDTGAIDCRHRREILAANADKVEQYQAPARRRCSAFSSVRR